MASNFYKNFKVKKSDGSQAELSSDKDFIDLALGTIIVSSSGDIATVDNRFPEIVKRKKRKI